MFTFREYLKEGISQSPDPNHPYDYFHPDDRPGDYITKLDKMRIIGGTRFVYKAFKIEPTFQDTNHAFRTPKNAAREYILANPNVFNLPDLAQRHTFDLEPGGKSLPPAQYNAFVELGLQMFGAALKKAERAGYKFNPTHVVTPSSMSPHAYDIARRAQGVLGPDMGINFELLPSSMRKSTKAEFFQTVFNPQEQEITQDLINKYIHKFEVNPAYRERIVSRVQRILIRDNVKERHDVQRAMRTIKNILNFFEQANIPLTRQISMADHIRLGPGGPTNDRNVVGYFDQSQELIDVVQAPGSKHIWVFDDNVSTGSTINAGEEFFNRVSQQARRNRPNDPRNSSNVQVSWFFLLAKL